MRGAVLGCTFALAFGCEVTLDDIEKWKETERGPLKIRTAASDDGQKPEIRVAAAVAMVDIDHLADLEGDLKALPPEEHRAIADSAIPKLAERMRGTNPKAPPNPAQVRAKDAVFALRGFASDAVRAQADAQLVEWLTIDLSGRMLQGSHSADKIVATVGVAAGPALAASLGPETIDIVAPAELLKKVGDAASIQQGAENLIRLAQSQKPTRKETYLAMGRLGGARVAQYLNDLALRGKPDQRLMALLALEIVVDPSSIPIAKAIASDAKLKDDLARLRDEAFGVLQEVARTGNQEAGDALLGFLGDKDEKVRWTAVDAICETQREELAATMIERLPAVLTAKPDDFHDFLEERVKKKIGARIAPALRKMLFSPNFATRLAAARLLGDLGSPEDVAALEKLARDDDTPIRGWPGRATVGGEARAAAEKLKKKRG